MPDRAISPPLPEDASPTLLVVGDLMLDRFVVGDAARLSPEAPVPVLTGARREARPGGAANVAANLRALGAEICVVGAVGDDPAGALLTEQLRHRGVDLVGLAVVAGRPTTVKERILAGHQQLVRLDSEATRALDPADEDALVAAVEAAPARLRARGRGLGAVVLSDYAKGVVSPRLAQAAARVARAVGAPLWVDPKAADWAAYAGASVITPNLDELARAVGRPLAGAGLAEIHAAAVSLAARVGARAILVTCGPRGILVCDGPAPPPGFLLARSQPVFDVTGAGDTVVAAAAWAHALGLSLSSAAHVAAVAAGIAVGEPGTAAVSRARLCDAWRAARAGLGADGGAFSGVMCSREAEARCLAARRGGQRVVFANGCFDLLHASHVAFLERARALGDVLIVGLNGDASVAALKGPGRPIVPFADRARLLAALRAVDGVVGFEALTPTALVAALRPAVLAKGADWRGREVAGADLLAAWGGRLALVDSEGETTTSSLVARVRAGGGAVAQPAA